MVSPAEGGLAHLSVPVGEGRGLIRWAMLSGMFMVSGAIWGWTGFTGDSGTFLRSFLSVDSAVNVIFILVLGNRKQHLGAGVKREHLKYIGIHRNNSLHVRIQNMVLLHVVVNDLGISNHGLTQKLIFEACVTSYASFKTRPAEI